MSKLTLNQTFAAKFISQIPDSDKPGVVKKYEFVVRFKLFAQTEEKQAELKKLQDETGNAGFLDYVLDKVLEQPKEVQLCDEEGTEMSAEEWVKQHMIVQSDAVLAYWDVVSKGVLEKNSKKSRSR